MATKDVTDLQVIFAYTRRQDGVDVVDSLQAMTGESRKVCLRAMERACDRGLIEYGVSLRTGWVTEEGKKLFDSLQ